ncbi:MAG: type II toxin-antitoxin system VapC family toxin [Actinomycetota bacterium]
MTGVVVDTSAAVAILLGEPAAEDLLAALAGGEPRLVSAATLVELGIVLEARLGPAGSGIVDRFVRDGGIEVVDFDRTHADRALEGWRRFGKGRHPAGLNLGDCFAYGLAVAGGHPVLCVGDDFARTDAGVVPPVELGTGD